jgi:predicted dehydrogenase
VKKLVISAGVSIVLVLAFSVLPAQQATPLRVGLIGLDTSHAPAFTQIFNDPSYVDHVPGAKVVAAFKGGSPDIEASASRVEGFTTELRDKWKIEIVPDIATLCSKVDAVILTSVDGRVHLTQIRPVLEAKKRVFIDKPLAASLADAREIARLADQKGVAWFSASSLRFVQSIRTLRGNPKAGEILGCDVYSPASLEPHHPDLYWYGIHGIEILYSLMGPGCETVTRIHTPGADVVVGRWKGGRIGTWRGIRDGKSGYSATVFGKDGILTAESTGSPYRGLMEEVVRFFQTGVSPVKPEETLEMFAFMEAADVSKNRDGKPVPMSELGR